MKRFQIIALVAGGSILGLITASAIFSSLSSEQLVIDKTPLPGGVVIDEKSFGPPIPTAEEIKESEDKRIAAVMVNEKATFDEAVQLYPELLDLSDKVMVDKVLPWWKGLTGSPSVELPPEIYSELSEQGKIAHDSGVKSFREKQAKEQEAKLAKEAAAKLNNQPLMVVDEINSFPLIYVGEEVADNGDIVTGYGVPFVNGVFMTIEGSSAVGLRIDGCPRMGTLMKETDTEILVKWIDNVVCEYNPQLVSPYTRFIK